VSGDERKRRSGTVEAQLQHRRLTVAEVSECRFTVFFTQDENKYTRNCAATAVSMNNRNLEARRLMRFRFHVAVRDTAPTGAQRAG